MSESSVKSAVRTLDVIEMIGRGGGATFTQVREQLSLPRSSAHALLRTLTESGWIEFDPTARTYRLGLRTWQVGQLYVGHRTLSAAAKPIMDELVRITGETAQLAQLDGLDNVYIQISHSPHPMRLASSVGMRIPAHATGIGKSLLSTLDGAALEARLAEADLEAFTPRTVTDPVALSAIVAQARVDGYATDDGEYVDGTRCVAVPVWADSRTGRYFALSVTMPQSRVSPGYPSDVLPVLQQAAREIRASADRGIETESV